MNYSTQISKILLDMDDLVVDDQLTNLPAFTLLFSELEMVAPRELVDRVQKAFNYQKPWRFGGADYASLEDRINAILTNDKNKVKVYTGTVIYEVMIDGTCHHIRDDDTVEYEGKSYTGSQFHAKFSKA